MQHFSFLYALCVTWVNLKHVIRKPCISFNHALCISGEDRTSSSSERGRALDERNYYVDQYQDRKLGGYHRNSGSLLMNKNGVTKPSSPMNVLTSPMGRAPESQDGRYLGKENLVKRVSIISGLSVQLQAV